MKKIKLENVIYAVIYCILAVLLVNRITYSIAHYDEVFNIYVSYLTGIAGKQHLVDNTYLFQTGDLFNLPFVTAYIRLTGSSEGVVLFLRFVYLFINAGLSVLFYYCFKDEIGKRNSILFSLIIMIYSPFEMYSVYYDTAAITFLLAGAFLLIKAPKSKNPFLFRIFAGVCHACMAYAYPLMAITVFAFVIIILLMEKEKRMKALLPYVLGGASVLFIFVLYVLLFCGIKNLFLFNEGVVESGVSKRGIGEVTGSAGTDDGVWWHGIPGMLQLYDIIMQARSSVYELIPLFFIVLLQVFIFIPWEVYWAKYGKKYFAKSYKPIDDTRVIGILKKIRGFRWILAIEIILPAWYNYRYQGGGFLFTRLYAHYFFYAPLLYFLLKDEDKRIARRLLAYLWVPGITGFLAVGYTAMFSNKAIMGLMPGAIVTLMFLVLIIRDCCNKKMAEKAFILAVATGHLALFYMNDYENVKLQDMDYKISEGIFRGLHGTDEDKISEDILEFLNQTEDIDTYYCNTKDMRYIAGISLEFEEYDYDMKSIRNALEEGEDISTLENLPDILIIDAEEAAEKDTDNYKVIYTLYNLEFEECGYKIYIKIQ